MKEFRVPMGHRPGELARVATMLGNHDVNIKAVAATALGNQVVLHLVADDVAAARAAFEGGSVKFEEHEVLTVLIEDNCGELAELAQKLANASINVDAIYVIGHEDDLVELVVACDNVKKAKKLLEE